MGFYSCNEKEVPQRVPLNKTESLCRVGTAVSQREPTAGLAACTSKPERAVSSDRQAVKKPKSRQKSVLWLLSLMCEKAACSGINI